MAAIEEALRAGPVHIMKRNRRAAVVLSEESYQELIGSRDKPLPGLSAMEWLQAHPPAGDRTQEQIDTDLAAERLW